MQFLPTLGQDISLEHINDALNGWLDGYHQRRHSATGKSPWNRFTDNMQCMRPAPDNLNEHFRMVARRTVAKDRSVTLNGRLFEAPVALIGKRIELLYHHQRPHRVEAVFKNKSYGLLQAVDMAVNCRVKRDRNPHKLMIQTDNPTAAKGGKVW